MLLTKTQTVKDRAFTLRIYAVDHAEVYWQHINPKTGEGWQAKRDGQRFEGTLANMKGLRAWEILMAAYRRIEGRA